MGRCHVAAINSGWVGNPSRSGPGSRYEQSADAPIA
jgi:hypothetical protein